MKFACDKCSAKYSIGDEKVRGKVLRIRCKKCGTIIEVREDPATADGDGSHRTAAAGRVAVSTPSRPAMGGAPPRPATGGHAPRPATGGEPRPANVAPPPSSPPGEPAPMAPDFGNDTSLDDEFERAFGRVVSPGESGAAEPPAPSDSDKTVLFDYSREFMNGSESGQNEAPRSPPAELPEEWYLAIDGQQVGPLPVAEARARVQAAEQPERIFAWHDGMGDWQLVAEVPELRVDAEGGAPGASDQTGNGGASIIEARVVSARGGVSMVAESGPEAPALQQNEAPAAALDLEIEFEQAHAAQAGAEPVHLEGKAARSRPFEPSPIAAPASNGRPRRRISIATLIILLLLLGGAVALLLAALDVIYIPYISTEPQAELNRGGRPGGARARRMLQRDPLLDHGSTRIVVRQVAQPKTNGKSRAVRRRLTRRLIRRAAAATPPAPEAKKPTIDPRAAERRKALRNLERRVYGGGVGAPKAPTLPVRFLAKTSVPLATSRTLSQSVISGVIRRYRGGIQNCYQKQLKVDSSVKGRMTLNLRVGTNGRVVQAGIGGAHGRTVVGKCVVRMARTWRFPPSGNEVEVDYPLILERPY